MTGACGGPSSRLFQCKSYNLDCSHSKTCNFCFCSRNHHLSCRRWGRCFSRSSPLSLKRTLYKRSACHYDNQSYSRHYYHCASHVFRHCDTYGRRLCSFQSQ